MCSSDLDSRQVVHAVDVLAHSGLVAKRVGVVAVRVSMVCLQSRQALRRGDWLNSIMLSIIEDCSEPPGRRLLHPCSLPCQRLVCQELSFLAPLLSMRSQVLLKGLDH